MPGDFGQIDAALAAVAARWPSLPQGVRQKILRLAGIVYAVRTAPVAYDPYSEDAALLIPRRSAAENPPKRPANDPLATLVVIVSMREAKSAR